MTQPYDLLKQLVALDAHFKYQARAPAGEAWFDTVVGSHPVLVSAPHACAHSRNGELKMQEEYTGAIALYLAQVCDCHAIVARHQADEDPNWHVESEYKNAIQSLVERHNIGFLIDLHGMMNRYHMGVAIGTIKGGSCDPSMVEPHFIDAGFVSAEVHGLQQSVEAWRNVVVDHPRFTGGVVNHTVTRFVAQQLNIQSVQIELASEVRVVESAATQDWPCEYRGNPEAIVASVHSLQSLIRSSGC